MSAVNLSISGRLYEIVCEDSQVEHVRSLAAELDRRAQNLSAEIGTQPEARLLLMVALTLADELEELKSAKEKSITGLESLSASEDAMTQTVMDLTVRIEAIAQRLERS